MHSMFHKCIKLTGVVMLYEHTSYFSRYVVIPVRGQTVELMAEFLLYLTYLALIDEVIKTYVPSLA